MIVIGYLRVAPADARAFLGDMAAFARETRARDGCLFFALAPDGEAEGRMLVMERWRDQAALSAHLAAEGTVAFLARWQSRMTGEVETFDAANQRPLPAI
nr:putative quinol monooxygenase [Aureimonas jatrophae]